MAPLRMRLEGSMILDAVVRVATFNWADTEAAASRRRQVLRITAS